MHIFDKRGNYQLVLEKSAIVALCIVILIFLLFPKFQFSKVIEKKIIFTSLDVEDIPVTHQGARRQPPPKPAVPIPTDDELFPEDVTIEETELDLNLYSEQDGFDFLSGIPVVYQPRPIFEVIPEYPQELQKKGVEGTIKLHLHINANGYVDDVVVLENTTGSSNCANAAKAAALKGRYIPARQKGKSTDIWIIRTYSFGIQR